MRGELKYLQYYFQPFASLVVKMVSICYRHTAEIGIFMEPLKAADLFSKALSVTKVQDILAQVGHLFSTNCLSKQARFFSL